eukprot:scaffold49056_cov47-Attheya_sp.AAC.1
MDGRPARQPFQPHGPRPETGAMLKIDYFVPSLTCYQEMAIGAMMKARHQKVSDEGDTLIHSGGYVASLYSGRN